MWREKDEELFHVNDFIGDDIYLCLGGEMRNGINLCYKTYASVQRISGIVFDVIFGARYTTL